MTPIASNRLFRKSYDDFRHGFWSGLIVTAWASSLAVLVGAALAIAIERYSFPCKQVLEGILLSPLFIPHFTIGLGLLMLVSQLNLGRGYPLVIFCHVVLVLPFVLRSVYDQPFGGKNSTEVLLNEEINTTMVGSSTKIRIAATSRRPVSVISLSFIERVILVLSHRVQESGHAFQRHQ